MHQQTSTSPCQHSRVKSMDVSKQGDTKITGVLFASLSTSAKGSPGKPKPRCRLELREAVPGNARPGAGVRVHHLSLHRAILTKAGRVRLQATRAPTQRTHTTNQATQQATKQTNKQTNKRANTQNTQSQTSKLTNKQIKSELPNERTQEQASKQASKQAGRQAGRQASKQANKQTTTQTKQTNKTNKQNNKQTNKQTNKLTN